MNADIDIQKPIADDKTGLPVSSATPLTALELNAIRLDPNHTVLTPDYLENLNRKQPN